MIIYGWVSGDMYLLFEVYFIRKAITARSYRFP